MKAVVLLSGGIDSTVALAAALASGRECSALFLDYCQGSAFNEHAAAVAVANHYSVPIAKCTLDAFFWAHTAFLTGGGDPNQSYVPARNLLLLAHGIAVAEAQGAGEVWFGANAEDHAEYPDCRPEFVSAMCHVGSTGTKAGVVVVAPHLHRSKIAVVAMGRQLEAPMDLTVSCHAPSGHCGKCPGCKLRAVAFGGA